MPQITKSSPQCSTFSQAKGTTHQQKLYPVGTGTHMDVLTGIPSLCFQLKSHMTTLVPFDQHCIHHVGRLKLEWIEGVGLKAKSAMHTGAAKKPEVKILMK